MSELLAAFNRKPWSLSMDHRGAAKHQFTRYQRVLAGLAMLFTLTACKAGPKTVSLHVVTFNYLSRPIYDVFIDGKSGDSSTPYPATGGSTISGVKLRVGPKVVTWKLDG